MKWMLKVLLLLGAIVGSGASQAETPNCQAKDQAPVGMYVKITQTCTAKADAGDPTDAYYAVEVLVEPQAGFADGAKFDTGSPEGKALKAFAKALFGNEKATNLDLGVTLSQGATVYPTMSLVSLQLVDNNRWASNVQSNRRTFLHKLTALDQFEVKLTYNYSISSKIDLKPSTDLIDAMGVKLITPAVTPIINAAGTFGNAMLKAGGVASQSGYQFSLAPAKRGGNISQTFDVVFNNRAIAKLTVRVSGTRSLLVAANDLELLQTTFPVGLVSRPSLNFLPNEIATGQIKNWSVLNAALGSMASLVDVAVGKELTKDQLAPFCGGVELGLSESYKLTIFDNLMIRAVLLEAATKNMRPKVNPYTRCFGDAERTLIKKHLGIETEAQEDQGPGLTGSIKDYEILYKIGCHFAGKAGPQCGSQEALTQRLSGAFAPKVRITELAVSNADMHAGIGDDGFMNANDLITRFGGRFVAFQGIEAGKGQVIVREIDGGPLYRITGEMGPDGKIVSISIRWFSAS